jgi:3-methyl-2-oxobutanoate hydroxymethyltransferase
MEAQMRNTTASLRMKKENHEKITMLTVYDYSTAKLMDACGIDAVLVGDSLGNVMLGYENTIPVTMADMIHHGKAVAKGCENAMVIVDMPFMSYQVSVEKAVSNAGRLMKETGAHAVKLEGGAEVCPQIKAIVTASVPVVGHLGLTPQSVHAMGGFKVQGRDREAAIKLIEDARAVEAAGAFALVLECVPAALAALITGLLGIPTIGIGAGVGCDGQVLVYQDMLAIYSDMKPKFVKQFGDVGSLMKSAFQNYIEETKKGLFPAPEHSFKIDDVVMNELERQYSV